MSNVFGVDEAPDTNVFGAPTTNAFGIDETAPKDPVEDYVRANDYTDTSTDPAQRAKKTQPTIPDLQGAGYAIPPVDYSIKDTDPVAYRKNLVRTATAYDNARVQHQAESPNNPLGDRTEFSDPEAFDEYKRRLQNTAKTSAQDDDAGSIATGVSLVRQGAQRFSQAAFSDEATNQAQIALNRADIAQHPIVGKVAYGVGKAIAPEMIPAYLVGGRINPIFFAGAQSLQQRSEDEEPTPVRNFAVGLAVNELSGVAGEQIGSAGVNALIRAGAHVATGSALQTGIGAAQAAYEGNLKEYVKNDLIPDAILGAAQAAPGAVHEFSPEARSNVINKLIAEHGLNRNTAARLVDEAAAVPAAPPAAETPAAPTEAKPNVFGVPEPVPETQTPAQPAPSPVAEAPRAAPVSTPAFIPDHDTVKQETPNANEEPSPAQLPVGEPPESSSGVRVGNPQGGEAPQARQAQGEDAQANREGAAQPDVHAPGQQPPENAAGGDAVRTLHPDIIAKAKAYDEAAAKNGFSIRDVTPAGYGNEGTDDLKPRHQSTEEQKLRNSVNEGKTLLRGSVSGEKRASIERSVKNSEARLAEITKDLAPSAETIDKSVPQRKVPKPSDAAYAETTPAGGDAVAAPKKKLASEILLQHAQREGLVPTDEERTNAPGIHPDVAEGANESQRQTLRENLRRGEDNASEATANMSAQQRESYERGILDRFGANKDERISTAIEYFKNHPDANMRKLAAYADAEGSGPKTTKDVEKFNHGDEFDLGNRHFRVEVDADGNTHFIDHDLDIPYASGKMKYNSGSLKKAPEANLDDALEAKRKEVGPGAANAEDKTFSNTPAEQNPETTGVKNAVSAEDRKRLGLPERETPEGKDFDTAYSAGKDAEASNPRAADELLDKLRADPNRPLNDEEVGLLLKRKVDLEKEFQSLNKEVGDSYAADDAGREKTAQDQLNAHRDKIADFTNLVEQAGTATARGLSARRMMSAMDYSLSHMESEAAAAKGSPLSDSELKDISDLHDQIQKRQAELNEADAENDRVEAQRRADESINDIKKQAVIEQKSAPIEPHIKTLADRIITRLDKLSNDALARIKARGTKINALGDPQRLVDEVIIGTAEIAKGVVKFADFSASMVAKLGDYIKPHLQEIFDRSNKQLDKSVEDATGSNAPKVKAALKANARPEDLIERMKERVKDGDKIEGMQSYIRKIALGLVKGGIKDREPLLNALHAEIQKVDPNITREKVRDILSGYGDFKPLDKNPDKATLRDIQQQAQKVAQLEALSKGKAPQKTGFERQSPSDTTRRLTKEVNEGKRKLGITTTDPETQLKSTLEAMKTRTRNTISDLQSEIDTKQRIVAGKTTPISDAELDTLRKQLAEVRKAHAEIFEKPGISDEQKLKMATAAAKANVDAWNDRLDKARRGQFDTPSQGQKITSPELDALRAQAKAAKAEHDELQAAAEQGPNVSPREKALLKQISDTEEKLKTGDTSAKASKQGPDTAFTAELKAKRDALTKQLSDLRDNDPILQAKKAADAASRSAEEYERKAQVGEFLPKGKTPPPETPELAAARAARESAKEKYQTLRDADPAYQKAKEDAADRAYQTALARREADLKERIAKQDFTTTPKTEPARSAKALAARDAVAKAREQFDYLKAKHEAANRTGLQKAGDVAVALRRMSVLSGYSVIKKLGAAAIFRVALTPAEEAVGSVIRRVFPKLAELAPREGGGLNLRAESEALKALWSKRGQALEKLKTGRSDLERVFGKPQRPDIVPKWLNVVGNIHSAIKEPVRQNEFIRSFIKRSENAKRAGRDLNSSSVLQDIGEGAKQDADRAAFQQPNIVADKVNRFISSFGEKNKDTGKVPVAGTIAKTVGNLLLPVKKVPLNLVAETFKYAGGLAYGIKAIHAERALSEGVSKLTPEQADAIFRNLKKGTVGVAAAAALLGFYGYKNVGGYYQSGEKRKADDVAPNEVRIFGVNIGRDYLHNPLFEMLQMGATMARVAVSKLHKKDHDVQGVGEGSLAGTLGLLQEVPLVKETADVGKILDPNTRNQALAQQAEGFVVPQIVSQLARDTDKKDAKGNPVSRKPEGLGQNLEMGIPGLRQNVPVRRR